ncbi:MAG: rhomboid family intramembrane serine protease [Opitutales bacterium]|jgi:membrane associated rhomboid family serine protease|nr:rhomboid family intramembrane serine protease [Opitutales bacterium]MDP4878657.1 rhomboid family intramembrane serine protease [Opitutales bacterium]MDP4883722.1 rhomboid family intramembrane serine protease [Opitutales bacterium]
MLYDRPYMRQSAEPAAKSTSIVMILIIATVAVFVLQNMLNMMFPGFQGSSNRFMGDWFALSGQNFKELKAWTVLSYGFLHSTNGIIHIVGNMLGLFFIGRMIESVLGKNQFLILYLGGTLFGGLVFLLFHYNSLNSVIGASGAVLAVVTFFCLLKPEQPITLLLFFVLPVTVKPKWIFWASLGLSVFGLIFDELPAIRDPYTHQMVVAHSAHLGGIIAGILYFRFVYNGSFTFFQGKQRKPAVELPEWFKRKQKIEPQVTYKVNRSNRDALQGEVDRILDKINATGFGSLTPEEKTTLDQAKDILSK